MIANNAITAVVEFSQRSFGTWTFSTRNHLNSSYEYEQIRSHNRYAIIIIIAEDYYYNGISSTSEFIIFYFLVS